MSLTITVECDKCEKKSDWPVHPGQDINECKVKEAPKYLSFFEAIGSAHICFDCMYEALGMNENVSEDKAMDRVRDGEFE